MTHDTRARLLALGDLMAEHELGSSPFYKLIQEADVSVANLEAPLTDRGNPADKTVTMKSPPLVADELARVGLTVAALANNHALDFGPEGMCQTREVLAEAGVLGVGTGQALEEAMRPVFAERNGLKVGFLSFSSTLPIGTRAAAGRPGMAPIQVQSSYLLDASINEEQPGTAPYVATEVMPEELARAVAAVETAKAQCDNLVVSLHWGVPDGWVNPAQGTLADYQRPLAHALIEAGADALLGTHPHVIHGIEIFRNKPIFYSLGNFTSHYFAEGRVVNISRPITGFNFDPGGFDLSRYEEVPEHGRAYAARLSLCEAGVHQVELLPYVLDHQGEPQHPDEENRRKIFDRLKAHSAAFCTQIEATDSGAGLIRIC